MNDFKIRYHLNDTIDEFKVRLFILGNYQVDELYYTKTFALMAKMVTVCILLIVVVAKNSKLHQIYVHSMHGDLQEDVYE